MSICSAAGNPGCDDGTMVHQRSSSLPLSLLLSFSLPGAGLRADDALRDRPLGRVVPAIVGVTNAAFLLREERV